MSLLTFSLFLRNASASSTKSKTLENKEKKHYDCDMALPIIRAPSTVHPELYISSPSTGLACHFCMNKNND